MLIRVVQPADSAMAQFSLKLNGTLVTDGSSLASDGRILGVVTGLVEGSNTITAHAGQMGAQRVVTNHRKGGPVFSSPRVQPWICATPVAQEGDDDTPATVASGLGTEAVDAQRNTASEVKQYHRTANV